MSNPADQAAIEDARFKAELSRTDASNTMTSLTEQSQMFKAGASQALASGMVSLAMSGNTGLQDSKAVDMPGVVGSQDTDEIIALKAKLPELETELASTPARTKRFGEITVGKKDAANNPEYLALQAEIAATKEKIDLVGADVAPRITDPSMLLRASGSDLLTMMNTREMMQRDINTYTRSQKGAALTMLENAGNYDLAARYAEETKDYNTLNTILGFGFKIAGVI